MQVELRGIGKTFGAQTVFSGITLTLSPGAYVILGGNGSGKSTLIKILSGSLSPGEGSLILRSNQGIVPSEGSGHQHIMLYQLKVSHTW